MYKVGTIVVSPFFHFYLYRGTRSYNYSDDIWAMHDSKTITIKVLQNG